MRDEGSNRYTIMVMIISIRKDDQEFIRTTIHRVLGILYLLHPLFKSITIINEFIFRR